jgi:hypothetical protein
MEQIELGDVSTLLRKNGKSVWVGNQHDTIFKFQFIYSLLLEQLPVIGAQSAKTG